MCRACVAVMYMYLVLVVACADAATFTVSSTGSGLADVDTLPYALSAANANPGPDVVIIALPPRARNQINLTASLPRVTGSIILQGGGVAINGAQLADNSLAGLSLDASAANSSVSNITFADFPGDGVLWAAHDGRMINVTVFGCRNDGLVLVGNRNVVSSSVFGNATAYSSRGNGLNGIRVSGTGNMILTSVISGNGGDGVILFGRSNVVQGNIIGLDAAGKAALGNTMNGITCQQSSDGTIIANNTVSGNLAYGMWLFGRNSEVRGNIVGLDVAGKVAVGNALVGISCYLTSENTTIANNTVSGNLDSGVLLFGGNNVVKGNIIGLDVAGKVAVGNGGDGIDCLGGDNTIIADNTVSGNLFDGMLLWSANNVVKGNIIGLDVAGKVAAGNRAGIRCHTSSENTTITNNTVSGNLGGGLVLFSRNNIVRGNIIGLDVSGKVAVGNALVGIGCYSGSDNTTITSNTVSGNLGNGVQLLSFNNVVRGNIIGLDTAGKVAAGNTVNGIWCDTGSDNTTITNNTVSGNLGNGVQLLSFNNAVQGNIIGLDVAGKVAVGNGGDGIWCDTGSDNTTVANNTIGGNGGFGVQLVASNTSSLSNVFLGNLVGTLVSTANVPMLRASKASRVAIEGTVVLPGTNGTLLLEVYVFETFNACINNQGRGVPIGAVTVQDSQAGARKFVRVTFGADVLALPDWASGLAIATTIVPWHTTSSMSGCVALFNTTKACAGLCDCSTNTTVDCSGRGLLFVPEQIPANTTRLLLNDNQISQLDPAPLAHLSFLTHLSLSGNPFDTDPTASIPPATAASLQVLNMSHLTGSLSTLDVFRASNFPALLELDISGNPQLSSLRTGAFSTASMLQSVRLHDCALTTEALMLANIGALRLITQLDLSNNRLTSLPSGFLVNASSLSELRLHFNNITFVDDHALRGATNLRVLDLSRQTTVGGGIADIPAGSQFVGLHALQAVRWTSAACPAGAGLGLTDEVAGIFVCLPCSDGTYLGAGGNLLAACRVCPSGTTDNDRDPATPCVQCSNRSVGMYTASGSTGECLKEHLCPAGTVDHDGNAATECRLCYPGDYTAAGSLGSCMPCAAGSIDSDDDAATECAACAAGTYVPAGKSGRCSDFACPAGFVDDDSNASTPCVSCKGLAPSAYIPAGSTGSCGSSRFLCDPNTEDHDMDPSTTCRPRASRLPPGLISVGGQVRACINGTEPEMAETPQRCIFLQSNQVPGCQIIVSDLGDALKAECRKRTRRTGEGLALLPPRLELLLPYVTHLDLSGWQPNATSGATVVTALTTLARQFGVGAPALSSLVLRNTGLASATEIWEALGTLHVTTSALSLDIAQNPSLKLPATVPVPLAELQFSSGMVPVASGNSSTAGTDALRLPEPPQCQSARFQSAGIFKACNTSGTGCITCGAGHFIKAASAVCQPCGVGGFFQDGPAFVGTHSHCACRRCGNGTFSRQSGATSSAQCEGCPTGTDASQTAGYRACACLPGHFRRGRLSACFSCASQSGVTCARDVRELKAGYWWTFSNDTAKTEYQDFIAGLKREDEGLPAEDFPGLFPKAYACPYPDACAGGSNASCSSGYSGVLCAACVDGYYAWLGSCQKCPRREAAVIAAVLIILLLAGLLFYLLRQNYKALEFEVRGAAVKESSKKADTGHQTAFRATLLRMVSTGARRVLIKAKIVISYVQVVAGLYGAFQSVTWPSNFRRFIGAFQFLNVNPLRMVMPSCLNDSLQLNAYGDMVVTAVLPLALALLVGVFYLARRHAHTLGDSRKIFKAGSIRNVAFLVFLLYPSACANVLRLLQPCDTLCQDVDETACTSYLSTDHTIVCAGTAYDRYVFSAYALAVVYIALVPLAVFAMLLRSRRRGRLPAKPGDSAVAHGLTFFYEAYHPRFFFWDLLEMLRKLILTGIIIFIGEDSFTQLAVGILVGIITLAMHLHLQPYADTSDANLQTLSLFSTVLIMVIGVALRGQQTKEEDQSGGATSRDNQGLGLLLIFICIGTFLGFVSVVVLHARQAWRQLGKVNRSPSVKNAPSGAGSEGVLVTSVFANTTYSAEQLSADDVGDGYGFFEALPGTVEDLSHH